MKKIPFIAAFILSHLVTSFYCCAQTGWQWGIGASYGPSYSGCRGWTVATDKSGNVFGASMVGNASSTFGSFTVSNFDSSNQLVITKASASGDYILALGSQGYHIEYMAAEGIATDTAGNVYLLVGYEGDTFTIGTVTLTPGAYEGMYALVKVTATGSVAWAVNVAPYFDGVTHAAAICTDDAGSIYAMGAFFDDSISIGTTTLYNTSLGGIHNFFITKYDASGSPIWARSINNKVLLGYNGGMAVSPYGTIYVTGTFRDTLTSGSFSLVNPSNDSSDFYVIKMDRSGNIIWGLNGTQHTLGFDGITTDDADRIYLSGAFYGNMTFGTTTFTSLPGTHGSNWLITCLDSSSMVLWAKAAYNNDNSGYYYSYPNSISVDHCGKICVTGSPDCSNGVITTPPVSDFLLFGTDTLHVPSGSVNPFFIVTYDTSGNYLNSTALPSGGGLIASSSRVDNRGNLYICGSYETTMTIGTNTLSTSADTSKFFIAKYHYDDAGCAAEIAAGVKPVTVPQETISLYPNPAHTQLNIESSTPINEVTVTNLLGQTVYHQLPTLNCQLLQPDVANLPTGMYLVRVNGAEVRKFMKE